MRNKIRPYHHFVVAVLFVFLPFVLWSQNNQLLSSIEKLPNVISVTPIAHHPHFSEAYEIMVAQRLDPKNSQSSSFQQRIILSHHDRDKPVVFVTEGYHAHYALKPTYINELGKILDANQIVVEHRYFGKSMPDSMNWDFLTIENAMHDLHTIRTLFDSIYPANKWVATGISKGGHTAIAYKAYFPNDMNAWVPYVGPLNFGIEDGRHEKFLRKVGDKTTRKKIEAFQLAVLTNRKHIAPLLDSLVEANKYTFSIPLNEVLDYCVLEYPFAFWQWGESATNIPNHQADARVLFEHLVKISNPDYFSHQEIEPIQAFFVQVVKEFGYYGYDTKPLKKHLNITSSEGYMHRIFVPDSIQYPFSKQTSLYVKKALKKDATHMMLIYGEYDPWTASGLKVWKKSGAVKIVVPQTSHRARIYNMDSEQQKKAIQNLNHWLSTNQ